MNMRFVVIILFLLHSTIVACQQNSYKRIKEDSIKSQSYLLKGDSIVNSSKPSGANVYYNKSKALFEKHSIWDKYTESLNGLASYYYLTEKYDSSKILLKESESIWLNSIKNEKGLALGKTYNILSLINAREGDDISSLKNIKKSLKIYNYSLGENNQEVAEAYFSLGMTNIRLFNYEAALIAFNNVYRIAKSNESNGEKLLIIAYQGLTNYHFFNQEYSKALEYSLQSLNISIKLLGFQHKVVADNYFNIGSTYSKLSDQKNAIKYLLKALENYISLYGESHFLVSYCYNNIGMAYYENNQYTLAKEYIEKSLEVMVNKLGHNHKQTSPNYNNLGLIEWKLKNFDKAIKHHTKALKIRTSNSPPVVNPPAAESYRELGKVYRDMKMHEVSIRHFQKSLTALVNSYQPSSLHSIPNLNIEVNNTFQIVGTLGEMGRAFLLLYKNNKNPKSAEAALECIDLAISIADFALTKKILTNASKKNYFEVTRGLFSIGVESSIILYKIHNSRKHIETAFKYSEKGKAFLLLSETRKLRTAKIKGIPDSLLSFERKLKSKIYYYTNQLQKSTSGIDTHNSYQDSVFNLNRQFDNLKARFKKEYPNYYKFRFDLSTTSISEIQDKVLTPSKTLIEYNIGDSLITIFKISTDTIELYEAEITSTLTSKWINNLRKSLIIKKDYSGELRIDYYKDYLKYSHLIYKEILQPLVKNGKKLSKTLVIIPDDVLGYLPFALLLQKQENYKDDSDFRSYSYLIQDYQISYSYSATLLNEKLKGIQNLQTSNTILALAPKFSNSDSVYSSLDEYRRNNLGKLSYNQEEVINIAKHWDGVKYIGSEATKNNFIKNIDKHKIIHLSTHAKANDKNPNNSFIAFNNNWGSSSIDSLLYLGEIYNFHIPANIVILSACETGFGKLQKGEGIMSLSRAFSYAGAKSLVSTFWSVDDKSTSIIMEDFHSYLSSGIEKDRALQLAQLEYMKNLDIKDYKVHPYYWGALYPSGDMNPIKVKSQFNFIYYLIFICFSFLIWLQYKRQSI